MEFHLKQWRSQKQQQHESEQQAPAKIPRLLLDSPHPRHNPSVASESQSEPEDSALQLFVSPPPSNSKISTHMSPSPHHHTPPSPTPIFPRTTRGYFSLAQRQELELQALIFRHMLAGVAVPPELLQPIIKKSLLDSYPHYLHSSLLQHPELVQSGYWGKAALDPEPGRCRRTDGKKWRCSRDVVAGHKYCERHVHRGRNRSRKHVELPTAAAAGRAASVMAVTPETVAASGMPFALSERLPSSTEILHPHPRPSESVAEKGLFGGRREMTRSDAQMLRPFFDDWPRPLPEESDCATPATSSAAAATSLSISIRPSDTSLTLSTGNDGGEMTPQQRQGGPSWGPGWGSNQVSSMGGPLAEALRSSVTSSSSPTSVLHRTPRCSAPRTSYVT